MDQTLFALPILPGKTEKGREFLRELGGARKEQFDASERRLDIGKEVWAIQRMGEDDIFVVYFAGRNIGEAFKQFAASRDEFDQWLKRQLGEITGADFNAPPSGPISEILVDYQVVAS